MPPRHQKLCESASRAVRQCHLRHGIQGEDCVREELLEKRCFAENLCRHEARLFYYEPLQVGPNSSVTSCSTLVEAFAFPENEMLIPDDITTIDPKQRAECRAIVHDLAKCLSKYKVGSGQR
jgi:hypothetical protein